MSEHTIRDQSKNSIDVPSKGRRSSTISRLIGAGLGLACLGSLAATFLSFSDHLAYRSSVLEPIREELITTTRSAAEQTARFLTDATTVAGRIATDLTRDVPDEQGIRKVLREAIEANDSLYGGTIAFEPYRWSESHRLYAPYYARGTDEGPIVLQIEDQYDYTEWDWYAEGMNEGPRWSEPYFDDSVGDIQMITYSAVFHEQADATPPVPRGVVTVDLSMDAISEVVRSLDIGTTGYAVLISEDGSFLYHPNEEVVQGGLTTSELARASGDLELEKLVALLGPGQRGMAEYTSPTTE